MACFCIVCFQIWLDRTLRIQLSLVTSNSLNKTPLFSSPHKVSTKDKRRAKAVKLEGEDQPVQSEWVDVEEEPRRSIGTPKQSTRAGPSSSSIHNNRRAYYRKRENSLWQDPANFLPQLGRISENENLESSKSRGKHSSTHGPDPVVTERRSYNISGRQGAPSYPSGSKGRISKLPYNFNASVLSVLSNATNSTQQSSASDSTITQKRYHRAVLEERARKAGQPDLSSVTVQSGLVGMESDPSTIDASTQPNVFDFLYDGKRPASNDGGFVVASETPSDTAASAQPTPPEYWLEASTSRNGSHRAENYRRASSKDEKADVQEIEGQEQRSGYNRVATLQQQGQAFHEHIAFTANPRRKSTVIDAEIEPDSTLLPEDLAHSQRYSYPAPKAIEDRISDQHHEAHTTLPAVPEAPDLSKTTLAGYELMAVKLTEASAAVRPLYRKFEQLEHRVLLHMQDEISELEEHLRVIDECLTQMANIPEDTARRPASRREDLHYGTELHHRRTLLLGQIYLKLEQYRKSNQHAPDQLAVEKNFIDPHHSMLIYSVLSIKLTRFRSKSFCLRRRF